MKYQFKSLETIAVLLCQQSIERNSKNIMVSDYSALA